MRFLRLISVVILLLIPGSLFSQKLQIGAGSVYLINNKIINSNLGYQIKLIYKAQNKIAILSTFGQYKDKNIPSRSDDNYIVMENYTTAYLTNAVNNFLPGHFSMVWFELSPIYYLFQNNSKNISIFSGIGLGLYYPEYKWSWGTYNILSETFKTNGLIYHEKDLNPNLGWNMRVGLNIAVTSNSYFNFELIYTYYKPNLNYEINLPNSLNNITGKRSINLNSLLTDVSLMVNL